jgi:hypothetical protein
VVSHGGNHATMNKSVLLQQPLLDDEAGFADALGYFVQPDVEIAYEISLIENTLDDLQW